MTPSRMAFIALSVFAVFGLMLIDVPTGSATTNFTGSTIIDVDQNARTVTFRTKEGERWTLPVDNPELLKDGRISQGDQVSIELDLNDRITKIIKPSDSPSGARQDAREEGGQ